jgi:YHS domain-containing protein
MTAQRQESHSRRFNAVFCGRIALIVALAVVDPFAGATTSERVVVNRFSGLAIEGFDPVAYFVTGQPVRGLPEFEASQGGAVWRFHNEGNRASFVAHPEVYGPQFGGYDPTDIARGVVFAGNPLFWVVSGDRLYLFGLEANRDAFAANPERFLPQARTRWPALEGTLAQ